MAKAREMMAKEEPVTYGAWATASSPTYTNVRYSVGNSSTTLAASTLYNPAK